MLVPKFVCDIFCTSLFTEHSIREAYNSTLPRTKEEFRNTLARLPWLAFLKSITFCLLRYVCCLREKYQNSHTEWEEQEILVFQFREKMGRWLGLVLGLGVLHVLCSRVVCGGSPPESGCRCVGAPVVGCVRVVVDRPCCCLKRCGLQLFRCEAGAEIPA